MAAYHYHPRRTTAEREVDAAVARAESRCRLLEARVDELESHIVAARHEAAAAGIFNSRVALPEAPAPAPAPRRALRVAARTALARAMLR